MMRPYVPVLGKKQSADNARFRHVHKTIATLVPRAYAEWLVMSAATTVRRTLKEIGAKQVAYAWSGGKDSIALEVVMERAGVNECLMGMCNLEYPAFLAWVTRHMPDDLEIVNTGLDLPWLAAHADMLFPKKAATAAKWFKGIQHNAQDRYFKAHDLDVLILGRRHADGNYTGKDGLYKNRKGIVRFSPIRHWTHEDVLAVCHYYRRPMPPVYDWPNGYVCGTGAWPARQWLGTDRNGWAVTYQIDPSIVHQAAEYLPSAAAYLEEV